jgi:hypothetical protein
MAVTVTRIRLAGQRAVGMPTNGESTVGAMKVARPRMPTTAGPPAS